MRNVNLFLVYFMLAFTLSSCQFECSVGDNKKEPEGKAKVQDDTRVYNDIKVKSYKAKLKRAYLQFEDGTRVPDDNFVNFSQPVNLILDMDGGWVVEGGKVFLGASEKIIGENGQVLVDAEDLFSAYTNDGISATDAKRVNIEAAIQLRENAPPTSFSVQFRVWDKKSDGYIEGSYMLFSK
jgi:hypothetical protein